MSNNRGSIPMGAHLLGGNQGGVKQARESLRKQVTAEMAKAALILDEMERQRCVKVVLKNHPFFGSDSMVIGYCSSINSFQTGYLSFDRVYFFKEKKKVKNLLVPMSCIHLFHDVKFPAWWDNRDQVCKEEE